MMRRSPRGGQARGHVTPGGSGQRQQQACSLSPHSEHGTLRTFTAHDGAKKPAVRGAEPQEAPPQATPPTPQRQPHMAHGGQQRPRPFSRSFVQVLPAGSSGPVAMATSSSWSSRKWLGWFQTVTQQLQAEPQKPFVEQLWTSRSSGARPGAATCWPGPPHWGCGTGSVCRRTPATHTDAKTLKLPACCQEAGPWAESWVAFWIQRPEAAKKSLRRGGPGQASGTRQ